MGFLDKFRRKPATSPGGSPIYRYDTPKDQGLRVPRECGVYGEEITDHFEKLFPGRKTNVFHELISDLVHIDVYIMSPTEDAGFYVLYTTGMSDLPMTLPDEIPDKEKWNRAELYMFLPGSWDFGKELGTSDDLPESSYWPIRILKFLARFPHEYETWLGWGHTIPNGPDYTPMGEDIGFGGVVLDALTVPPLELSEERRVNFYMVIPAYKQEIQYKLKYGMEELAKVFSKNKMPMVLDVHRPNYCADFTEILDGPETE